MDREELMEELEENEALFADGFEDALIGWVRQFNRGPIALYDQDRCIDILMTRDGMDYEEASEYLSFNTLGAWVGEGTPAFCRLLDDVLKKPDHPFGQSSGSEEESTE